jgi:hypothetical protein
MTEATAKFHESAFCEHNVTEDIDRFTALRFTATSVPSAEWRMRILPMNQYACWTITFGM